MATPPVCRGGLHALRVPPLPADGTSHNRRSPIFIDAIGRRDRSRNETVIGVCLTRLRILRSIRDMGLRVRTTSDLAKVEREPLHVQLGSLPYAVAP
ncbi:MAG: hypothetical protein Q7R41_05615, partial [Phycisphaerales bacterium]|nr:hypothetical protein [Phycisphaerales bacterium]